MTQYSGNVTINDPNGQENYEEDWDFGHHRLSELSAYIDDKFNYGASSMVIVLIRDKENAEPTPYTRTYPKSLRPVQESNRPE